MARIQTIEGRKVGSQDELRVANALYKYKLRFKYQVPIDGGRGRRGGQVLDFLVYNPFPVPCPVNGEYWHKGQLDAEERLLLARLAQIFGREPVVFWTADTKTQEAADSLVRRKLL